MNKLSVYVLSEQALTALRFIERFRHLTARHIGIVTGQKRSACHEMLRRMEMQKLLGHFGNIRLGGHGKMPKHYFLTLRGHRAVTEDREARGEETAPFRPVNRAQQWTDVMRHRNATIEIMMSLERDVARLPEYELVQTFVECRKNRLGKQLVGETEDYVAEPKIGENKIIPDAGFVLCNTTEKKRALFFIECDLGTTTIEGSTSYHHRQDICYKFTKYDRYLTGGMFRERYKPYGEFPNFTMLFVTLSDTRISNIRKALHALPERLHDFYRLATMDEIMADFFHDAWRSRTINDEKSYRIIRGTKGQKKSEVLIH